MINTYSKISRESAAKFLGAACADQSGAVVLKNDLFNLEKRSQKIMKLGVNGVFRQKGPPSRHGQPGGDTHGKGGSGAGIEPAPLLVIGFGLEGHGIAALLRGH